MESNHRPPHILEPGSWYHITASTYHKARLFEGDERKQLLRDLLQSKAEKFSVTLRAWVLLDDHYHLLCRFSEVSAMPKFIGEWHGASAHELNRLDGVKGRLVWKNYWDKCIRHEQALWAEFNYIHQNPVKHGYVKQMDEWDFSSYNFWLEKQGRQWMMDCLEQYPVVDFVEFTG